MTNFPTGAGRPDPGPDHRARLRRHLLRHATRSRSGSASRGRSGTSPSGSGLQGRLQLEPAWLMTTVTTDENGSYEALLPSTETFNCPIPQGPCPGMYLVVVNDPGDKAHPNENYNPNYLTASLGLGRLAGPHDPARHAARPDLGDRLRLLPRPRRHRLDAFRSSSRSRGPTCSRRTRPAHRGGSRSGATSSARPARRVQPAAESRSRTRRTAPSRRLDPGQRRRGAAGLRAPARRRTRS